MSKSRALNAKQELFCLAYASLGNARAAAQEAGYSGNADVLKVTGYRLLSQPQVQQRVNEHLEVMSMDSKEVLRLLALHAKADLGAFITDGKPDLERAQALGLSPLIKRLTWDTDGAIKSIELVDSQAALDKLARANGLYSNDKVAIEGHLTMDAPLPDLSHLSYEEIVSLYELRHGHKPLGMGQP